MSQVTINREEVQTLELIAADLHTIASSARTADAETLALDLAQADSMLNCWAKWLANEAEKQASEKPLETRKPSRYVYGIAE